MPALEAPFLDEPLRAWSTFLEGRYRLTPRLYVAARGEYLGFSKIQAGVEYEQSARHVGRAGDARGDRRRLFDSAQRAREDCVSI